MIFSNLINVVYSIFGCDILGLRVKWTLNCNSLITLPHSINFLKIVTAIHFEFGGVCMFTVKHDCHILLVMYHI